MMCALMTRLVASLSAIALVLASAGMRVAEAQQADQLTWSKLSDRKPSVMAFSPSFDTDRLALFGSSNKDNEHGIWRSTDGGDTWVKSSQGIPEAKKVDVYTIEFSPSFDQDNLVYASVNKQKVAMREAPGALFRSADGGQTWEEVEMSGFPSRGVRPLQDLRSLSLSPDFLNDGTMFAVASATGLYRSTDRGSTWKQLLVENAIEIRVAPTYPKEPLVVATTNSAGILFSTDGGDTWAPRNTGIEGVRNFKQVIFSADFADDRTMLALSSSDGIFISKDAGETWESVVRPPSNGQMAMMATTPNFVAEGALAYALTNSEVFLSADLGRTWKSTDSAGVLGGQIQGLFMPPDFATSQILYAVSVFGGLYRYYPVAAGSEQAIAATAAAVKATATAQAIPTALAREKAVLQEELTETGCITYYIAPPFLLGLWVLSRRQRGFRR